MGESSIIKKLEEYQEEIQRYVLNIKEDMFSCYKREKNDEKLDFITESGSLSSLTYFIRDKVYPYIVNNEILNKEFGTKASYYNHLNNGSRYKELINKLYNNINNLYCSINQNLALDIEKKLNENEDYYSFFIDCGKAVKSLNVNCKPENGIDNSRYKQLVNLINDKTNYYTLDLEKPCGAECEEVLVTNDNILNKYETITQYEVLEKPLKSEIPGLITNTIEFESLKKKYKSTLDELKRLLKGNMEEESLNYFYLFQQFMKCEERNKFYENGEYLNCMYCIKSTEIVLKELLNYMRSKELKKLNYSDFSLDTETGKACINGEYLRKYQKTSNKYKFIVNMLEKKKMNIYELAKILDWEDKTDYEKAEIKEKMFDLKNRVMKDIKDSSINFSINDEDIFVEESK